MNEITIKGFVHSENIAKFNELLRFFDGIDNLVETLYNRVQQGLGGTLENVNAIMNKPMYVKCYH